MRSSQTTLSTLKVFVSQFLFITRIQSSWFFLSTSPSLVSLSFALRLKFFFGSCSEIFVLNWKFKRLRQPWWYFIVVVKVVIFSLLFIFCDFAHIFEPTHAAAYEKHVGKIYLWLKVTLTYDASSNQHVYQIAPEAIQTLALFKLKPRGETPKKQYESIFTWTREMKKKKQHKRRARYETYKRAKVLWKILVTKHEHDDWRIFKGELPTSVTEARNYRQRTSNAWTNEKYFACERSTSQAAQHLISHVHSHFSQLLLILSFFFASVRLFLRFSRILFFYCLFRYILHENCNSWLVWQSKTDVSIWHFCLLYANT